MHKLYAVIIIYCLSSLAVNGQQFRKSIENHYSNNLFLSFESNFAFGLTDYPVSRIGVGGRGELQYFFEASGHSSFGIKLLFSYNRLLLSDIRRSFYNLSNDIRTRATHAGAGVVYSYKIFDFMYPYAFLGVGPIWFEPEMPDGNKGPNNEKGIYSNSKIQYDFMLGINFPVAENVALTADAGYHMVNSDYLDDVKDGYGNDSYVTFAAGISFSFFGKKDNDKDGINNTRDECPDLPEDFDGYKDYDGCPDTDNDEDGIPDISDKCTNLPEDFDGFEDSDGCPDLDNDRDGIVDANDKCLNSAEDFDDYEDSDGCPDTDNDRDGLPDNIDKCPNLKEDFDGFSDDDGCPDEDNDSDGIPDLRDKCPEVPETYNGYQDTDGCPDTLPGSTPERSEKKGTTKTPETRNPVNTTNIPAPNTREESEKEKTAQDDSAPNSFFIDGVKTFDNNGTKIKSDAYNDLDRIVNTIKKYPSAKWQIGGHMDNSGKPAELKKISEERARAIYNYFISKGLNSKNFKVVGFGDRNPIESNDKTFGRMRNRRVEIKRIP